MQCMMLFSWCDPKPRETKVYVLYYVTLKLTKYHQIQQMVGVKHQKKPHFQQFVPFLCPLLTWSTGPHTAVIRNK